MTPLSECREPATAASLLALGVPALLVGIRSGAGASGDYRTSTRAGSPNVPSLEEALRAEGACIAPLLKSDRNPYAAFVFVGRASTCDIVLRDASISKTHAVFERAGDAWTLRDNHSHNGTWIDGKRLSQSRASLSGCAGVVFGSYPAYLLMPDDLRRILETMVRAHV